MNILSRHPRPQTPPPAVRYEIVVEGKLGRRWANWFEGFELSEGDPGRTELVGCVDQAALHAALSRVRDLGMALVSVRRLDTSDESATPER